MGHRPFEEMAVLGGIAIVFFTYAQFDYQMSVINQSMTCLFLIASIVHEGFRLAALWYYLGFFAQFISYAIAIGIYNDKRMMSAYAAMFFMLSLVGHGVLVWIYGPGDMSKLTFDGPYKVGAREFFTAKHSNDMTAYYPIDQQDYTAKINNQDLLHCKHGKKYSVEQSNTQRWVSGGLPIIPNLCYEQTFLMQDVVQNATLAADFKYGSKKLRPILFSHGITSKNTDYSGLFKYLASHGYIVFGICHNDSSAQYTKKEDGTEIHFDTSVPIYNRPRREQQTDIRVQELLDFQQELQTMDPKLHAKIFGDQKLASIDMKYFTLAGHSFGGCSSLVAASKMSNQKKLHAVMVLDPWVFAYEASWNVGDLKVNCPIQLISTEEFWTAKIQMKFMDGWKTLGNILKYGKSDSKENICALNLGHSSQHDHVIFQPFSIGLLTQAWPQTNYPDVYMMYPQLFLRFLAELDQKEKQNGNFGLKPYVQDLSKSLARLKKLEPTWIKYDMRHAFTNPY